MKPFRLILLGSVPMAICLAHASLHASIYTGGGTNPNDWFDPDNWGPSAAFGGAGDVPMLLPAESGGGPALGATFGNRNFTFNQVGASADFLVIGSTAGQFTFTMAGGDLTYGGDGLFGINGFDGATFGPATIEHTGGTLKQVAGGAGFLIGHSQAATYNLSGGMIIVDTPAGRQLGIDPPDFGGSGNPSFLNISGTGLVEVMPGVDFKIGPAGVLDILDEGKLIWRNRTMTDVASLGGTIRAIANQVGPDIEFTTDRSPEQLLVLTIDRDSGAIVMSNSTGGPLDLASYSLRSASGALNSDHWTSIAATGDSNSGGSRDPDDIWNEFTAPGGRQDLSEGTVGSAVLADGATLPLDNGSAGTWIRSYTEDVTFQYLLGNGQVVEGLVAFTGNGGNSFDFGDLDFDGGVVDFQDWDIFVANFGADLTGLSAAEAYAKADLNGDGVHSVADFTLFQQVYDAQNGVGALAALIASVPEPASAGLLALAIACGLSRRSCRRARVTATRPVVCGLLAACVACWTPAIRVDASAYVGGGAANSWFDGANWGAGDFTGGVGVVPTQSGNVGAAFGDVDFTFNETTDATSLYLIIGSEAGNTFTMAGGQLTFTGDGLLGSTLSAASGDATINHTGGTLIQTGGGAGFLVGHTRGTQYTMTGGRVEVQSTVPSLAIDWNLGGTPSVPSTLSIGNGAVVDVGSPRLRIGPQGNLHVTGSGVLIWRNRQVADVFSSLSGGVFEGVPVIDGGLGAEKVLNAMPIQVGDDVHFVEGTTVIQNMALSVNTLTGELVLGGGNIGREIDFYQLSSASGALDPAGWASTNLDTQGDVDTLGPGSGESWAAAPLSSANALTEFFLTGGSFFDLNRSESLGFGFDTGTAVEDRDLVLTVRSTTGQSLEVPVIYVSPTTIDGDFDGDNDVDGFDFLQWQRGGSSNPLSAADFTDWEANFGTSAASGSLASAGVPEPTTALLALLALFAAAPRQRSERSAR